MLKKLDKMFFSQSSLEIFNQCKIKFKKRYIDGLFWRNEVSDSKESSRTEKGRLFNLFAYRYFLNLDLNLEVIEAEHTELVEWLERLKRFVEIEDKSRYYPEFEIRMAIGQLKIQAKFDLIKVDKDGKVTIYDWKVNEKPLDAKRTLFSFQTIVYRYLLARSGEMLIQNNIDPQNIKMIYWQPTHPVNPIGVEYSSRLFQEDEVFLSSHIEKILSCNFDAPNIRAVDEKVCKHCEFCSICNDFQPDIEVLYSEENDGG